MTKPQNYIVYIIEDGVEFYFFEGTSKEICERLNISAGTFKSSVFRGCITNKMYKFERDV